VHHVTGAVAQWHHTLLHGQRIGARENEGVPAVERRRVDADGYLRRPGSPMLSLAQDDAVDAADLVEMVCTHVGTIDGTWTAVDYVEVMARDEGGARHRRPPPRLARAAPPEPTRALAARGSVGTPPELRGNGAGRGGARAHPAPERGAADPVARAQRP